MPCAAPTHEEVPSMRSNSRWELLRVNAYWPGLSFMWNTLHTILLPAVLLTFVDDARKNTALGLMTFAGLMIALIVQPISGAVSDAWVSRHGRRRPLILIGTALDLIFLAIIGTAGDLGALTLGYVGLQFTSNLAHGPAQGLMHDRVAPERMGLASGVKNFLDMAGLVGSSLVAGRLPSPDDPGRRRHGGGRARGSGPGLLRHLQRQAPPRLSPRPEGQHSVLAPDLGPVPLPSRDLRRPGVRPILRARRTPARQSAPAHR